MASTVKKSREMTNAKIKFVSLVDKAANKRKFLVTKAENADGAVNFQSFGRIVQKSDCGDTHHITGIVYEPDTKDSDDEFMNAEEIEKAAHYFAKNGYGCDLQHNEEVQDGVAVVESWVAKADFEIDGEEVKKGSWLMTTEISDESLWEKVQKKQITGYSMGGTAWFTEVEDEETDDSSGEIAKSEDESFIKKIASKVAKVLGVEEVAKGEVKDKFNERTKSNNFWEAFHALDDTLVRYDWSESKYVYEEDETKIREALSDFNDIVTDILINEQFVAKAIKPTEEMIAKAGKKMSAKNKEALDGIYNQLGEFLKGFDETDENADDDKEEVDMTKAEVKKMITESISAIKEEGKEHTEPVEKSEQDGGTDEAPVTMENIRKMMKEEIKKALNPDSEDDDEPITKEDVKKMIEEAVEPIRKSSGLPTNLNGEGEGEVEKQEHFYLEGVL